MNYLLLIISAKTLIFTDNFPKLRCSEKHSLYL